ncbi:hypothetical protein J4470_04510 [Candidatus Woesearchaeota archaeon]|nr:hypothetical protein [Candidatus Woesearchaeota archaeon]
MKCVFCNSVTEERLVDYEEVGVKFGKYKAHVCKKCGEAYFDSGIAEIIQKKSKDLGLFGLAKKTKVAEIGNSLAIRVPKRLAEFVGLKKGKEVTLMVKEKNQLNIEL